MHGLVSKTSFPIEAIERKKEAVGPTTASRTRMKPADTYLQHLLYPILPKILDSSKFYETLCDQLQMTTELKTQSWDP